jgi:SAM-dependent methyltransferase
MATNTSGTEHDRDAFVERVVDSATRTMELYGIYLGDRLGFYRALADGGPLTAAGLAAATDTDERYVREWCEHGAVTGVLAVEDATAAADQRRYSLPDAHAEALADEESLAFVAPFAQLLVGMVGPIEQLLEAYRTGEGVAYADYGRDTHEGIARANRPALRQLLGGEWLPALPDVDARLRRVGARVADVGCGHGHAAIGIARAYPTVTVDGFDLDAESVAAARENVAAEGLAGRVRIHRADAANLDGERGGYDLVTAFECVHDMADPVGALRAMRALAGEDGTVLVVDERAGDAFAEPSDVEGLLYGFSILHCLPVGMADRPSAATGTVMRADTFRGYAEAAGFGGVDRPPIEHDLWQFYRLEGGSRGSAGTDGTGGDRS